MEIRQIFRRLGRHIARRRGAINRLPPESVKRLLAGILQTRPQEIACDAAYALLDSLADRTVRGQDAATLMPLVQKHVEMCPDCREEFDMLLRSLMAPAG
jgi:hypothetical protein